MVENRIDLREGVVGLACILVGGRESLRPVLAVLLQGWGKEEKKNEEEEVSRGRRPLFATKNDPVGPTIYTCPSKVYQ